MDLLAPAFFGFLIAIWLPVAYLYVLALASIRAPKKATAEGRRHRFAIAIAAHDEEAVIAATVSRLRQQDYPAELYDIHVVADHCSDRTAEAARNAGATVHERFTAPRGSKGAALRWLFERVLGTAERPGAYDAVVIFDADTHVAVDFLRVMDARLSQGDHVVQGQHRIRNPEDGWFAALTWAMFIIDNRLQNLGRTNLGWSAKNMGDSICFRADVLRRLGWGEGLTEDYAFRQQLLLEGIRISYEPAAVGYGEAPLTWAAARKQRARWLRGAHDASRRYARKLLRQGLSHRNMLMLDGALQAHLPAYSTLTVVSVAALVAQAAFTLLGVAPLTAETSWLLIAWCFTGLALFAYPLVGLALERAPLKAYAVILSGPVFIGWRSWLAVVSRRAQKEVVWVRTPRRQAVADQDAGASPA